MTHCLPLVLRGLGVAGAARQRSLIDHPHFRLAGIVSRRNSVATLSWEAFLADTNLPYLAISTENADHYPAARAALLADKSVLCDYPPAGSSAELAELLELAQSRGKIFHVEHITLLTQEHRKLRDRIRDLGSEIKATFYFQAGPIQEAHPELQLWARLMQLMDWFGVLELEKCERRLTNDGTSFHLHLANSRAEVEFTELRQRGLERRRSLIVQGKQGQIFYKSPPGHESGLFARDLEHFYARIEQKTQPYYEEAHLTAVMRLIETIHSASTF